MLESPTSERLPRAAAVHAVHCKLKLLKVDATKTKNRAHKWGKKPKNRFYFKPSKLLVTWSSWRKLQKGNKEIQARHLFLTEEIILVYAACHMTRIFLHRKFTRLLGLQIIF